MNSYTENDPITTRKLGYSADKIEVLKNPRPLYVVADKFYPFRLFGGFSTIYLLEITNLSGAFNLLIDFRKHQWT
jgi:hypothetical protein